MADVRLNGVSKTYGGARANTISGFDLHINAHEFVVLVGPSGCGKSTMLRMIAGLEDLSAGEIWIGGRRVDELEPRERNIAMVFQNYALYPHMTIAQNMGFGLWLAGVPKDEIRRRVDEAAKTLGIAELMGRRPKALSGGQRQRVAMGRAMVRDPAVFLFDEPLSNLDANLRAQMRAEIRELHRRLNATTIYVTHDQVEAMTLADRVVVLNNGRIEQQGAPQELYAAPATRFVAGFIGSPPMNMLPGRLEGAGDGLLLRIGEIGIPLPAPLAGRYGGHAGRAVQVGIRPEHFLPDAAAPQMVVPVLMAEALGPATLIHFTLEGTRCAAMIAPEAARAEGEAQPLRIAAERIVLFDPGTGHAI